MELLFEILLFVCGAIMVFLWKSNKEVVSTNTESDTEVDTQKILNEVNNFLSSSKYIDPIGNLNNKTIYKFITNNSVVYQFDDIMSTSNQEYGIDDYRLCFDRLSYKRIKSANPSF